MSKSNERDKSPERKPENPQKTLTEILEKECGTGFTKILVYAVPGLIDWQIWEPRVKEFARNKEIVWNEIAYAEILGFFIHWVFETRCGEVETKLLLSHITLLCEEFEDYKVQAIFHRLNQLNLFDIELPMCYDIHPDKIMSEFVTKLALFTSLGLPWVHLYGNKIIPDTWYIWDMSKERKELATTLELDPRFKLIKPDA